MALLSILVYKPILLLPLGEKGFPGGSVVKNPWVRKIPWKRKCGGNNAQTPLPDQEKQERQGGGGWQGTWKDWGPSIIRAHSQVHNQNQFLAHHEILRILTNNSNLKSSEQHRIKRKRNPPLWKVHLCKRDPSWQHMLASLRSPVQ